jgi:hypothetical protein
MWCVLALALALGLTGMHGAAQRSTIMTNGRKPPDSDQPRLARQAARLHVLPPALPEHPPAEEVRLGRRLSASGPQFHGASLRADQDENQLWNDGSPGFANVTAMDPDLFQCPYLRMQNAANYDFTPQETARMHDYLVKGGFLWIDDNWDPDFEYILPNLMRILPDAKVVDLPVEHPMFSVFYQVDPLPQIPSLNAWRVRVRIPRSGRRRCTTTECSTSATGWSCWSA